MLKQGLHQKLLQKLSPQQIQLMKLLQVPTTSLEQRIKEELERKSSANLELNQQVKELKSRVKELQDEVETVTRGALLESKRESSKIKREHGDMLSEMELKLRSIEKEASMREDALRQEVSELRKRWQDAVDPQGNFINILTNN